MNLRAARKIDLWLGVLFCLILSVFNLLQRAFEFNGHGCADVRKILFIKLSEMGAIILAYPLVLRLRAQYPRAQFFFLTLRRNKEIFPLFNGLIPEENILLLRESVKGFCSDAWTALARLRRERVDLAFDLDFFSRFSAILAFLSGAQKRAGFYAYNFEGLYRGELLTHKVQYNPLLHTARSYFSFAQAIEENEKSAPRLKRSIDDGDLGLPKYLSRPEARSRLLGKLEDNGLRSGDSFILIAPGEGTIAAREWPLENFVGLSRLLLKDGKQRIILVGGEGSLERAGLIIEGADSPRCVNMASKTLLDELMELFLISGIFVAADCGLAHLASLTEIKQFVLFGPESPQVFAPLSKNCRIIYSHLPCSPCLSAFNHRSTTCCDNVCLKLITPQEVCSKVLNENKN